MQNNNQTQDQFGNSHNHVLGDVFPTSKWFSVFLDQMPERNKTILLFLPFCRHKADVGYFNGVDWKTISGLKCYNVCY